MFNSLCSRFAASLEWQSQQLLADFHPDRTLRVCLRLSQKWCRTKGACLRWLLVRSSLRSTQENRFEHAGTVIPSNLGYQAETRDLTIPYVQLSCLIISKTDQSLQIRDLRPQKSSRVPTASHVAMYLSIPRKGYLAGHACLIRGLAQSVQVLHGKDQNAEIAPTHLLTTVRARGSLSSGTTSTPIFSYLL